MIDTVRVRATAQSVRIVGELDRRDATITGEHRSWEDDGVLVVEAVVPATGRATAAGRGVNVVVSLGGEPVEPLVVRCPAGADVDVGVEAGRVEVAGVVSGSWRVACEAGQVVVTATDVTVERGVGVGSGGGPPVAVGTGRGRLRVDVAVGSVVLG